MDKEEKDLQDKLAFMKADIHNASDEELSYMGRETKAMLEGLVKELGRDNMKTQACEKLLDILRYEYLRRNAKKVQHNLKAPATYNQLMGLGDGEISEPEVDKKAVVKFEAPNTYCEFMART